MTVVQRDIQWFQNDIALELRFHGHFIDRVAISTPFATLFNDHNAFLLAMRRHDPELPYPGAEDATWSDAWFRCITADSVTTNDSYYEGKEMSQPHRLHDDPDEKGFKARGRYVLAEYDP